MVELVRIIADALHGWSFVALLTAVLIMVWSDDMPVRKAPRWAINAGLALGGLSALLGLLVGTGVIHG